MGGPPHVDDAINSELYTIPVKRRQPKDQKIINQSQNIIDKSSDDCQESEDKDENLPTGWEKHEGE